METIITSLLYEGFSLFMAILPFGFVFFFLEQMNKAEEDTPFFRKDLGVDFFLKLINVLLGVYLISALLYVYLQHILAPYFHFLSFTITDGWPVYIEAIIGIILYDLMLYWRHWIMHRFFWPFHAIHHSAEKLTWLTGLRIHPGEFLFDSFANTTFFFIIGFEPETIIQMMLLVSALNYLNHTNIKLKFPRPFRFLLCSPHYHRWHHADKVEAYDKNFASIFPLWDKIFGTYHHPETLPEAYGLNARERHYYSNTLVGALVYPFADLKRRYFSKGRTDDKKQEGNT